MQVSKYLYKHFAQLNCHNLNYGVKITSAVLLQYVKALCIFANHPKFLHILVLTVFRLYRYKYMWSR